MKDKMYNVCKQRKSVANKLRMKTYLLTTICLVLVFLLSCQQEPVETPEPGSKTPLFRLEDLKGKMVKLSDVRGKVVILEFWATWCLPCRESMHEIERLFNKYKNKDLAVLGISVDMGRNATESVKAFVQEYGITYPILMDYNGKVSKLYGVMSIPTTYILDKDHSIVNKYVGFIPGFKEGIANQIEELL